VIPGEQDRMTSERRMVSNTPHRIPKKGFAFLLIRSAGLLLKVVGLLLCGIAVTGFLIMLVRIVPTIIESIQYIEQKMAGLIFLTSLSSLLVFPAIGLAGAVIAVLGFALGYFGTEPTVPTMMIYIDPSKGQSGQIEKPSTK